MFQGARRPDPTQATTTAWAKGQMRRPPLPLLVGAGWPRTPEPLGAKPPGLPLSQGGCGPRSLAGTREARRPAFLGKRTRRALHSRASRRDKDPSPRRPRPSERAWALPHPAPPAAPSASAASEAAGILRIPRGDRRDLAGPPGARWGAARGDPDSPRGGGLGRYPPGPACDEGQGEFWGEGYRLTLPWPVSPTLYLGKGLAGKGSACYFASICIVELAGLLLGSDVSGDGSGVLPSVPGEPPAPDPEPQGSRVRGKVQGASGRSSPAPSVSSRGSPELLPAVLHAVVGQAWVLPQGGGGPADLSRAFGLGPRPPGPSPRLRGRGAGGGSQGGGVLGSLKGADPRDPPSPALVRSRPATRPGPAPPCPSAPSATRRYTLVSAPHSRPPALQPRCSAPPHPEARPRVQPVGPLRWAGGAGGPWAQARSDASGCTRPPGCAGRELCFGRPSVSASRRLSGSHWVSRFPGLLDSGSLVRGFRSPASSGCALGGDPAGWEGTPGPSPG